MSYESVKCNECGTVLQVPSSARYVTCNRCQVPLVVHRTAVATYTEAVPRRDDPAPAARESDPAWREMADRLEHLEVENELARIDREWDRERGRYMVYSRYGRRVVPNAVLSIGFGVVFGTMGLGAIGMGLVSSIATRSPAGLACCLPGLFLLGVGTLLSVLNYNKAQQYQRAHDGYLRRRAAVLGERPGEPDEDYDDRRDSPSPFV